MRAARECRGIGFRLAPALFVAIIATMGAVVVRDTPAEGHVPHHTVGTVAVSPDFATDQAALTVVRQRLFATHDGGASWREVVAGVAGKTLQTLAYDPNDAQTVLLGTAFDGAMQRSIDGGHSWTQSNTGLSSFRVTRIAWSTTVPGLVLASGGATGVARSADGGVTWADVGTFGHVDGLGFAPSGTVFAGDESGTLWASTDDGVTWATIFTVPSGARISDVAAAANNLGSESVLVGTETGELFLSDDGGATFNAVGAALPAQPIASVTLSPNHATDQTAWLSTADDGAYTSTDGGLTWTLTDNGLSVSPQAAQLGFDNFGAMTVSTDPASPVLFLEGYDGLFRSIDGAATWIRLDLLVDHLTGLAVSPDFANDQTVVVTSYVKGAFVSTDGGVTWDHADTGLGQPLGEKNSFAAVRRLYKVVASPDYANDRTFIAGTINGVAITGDGGVWWDVVQPGPPSPARVPAVALSPEFATDRTIFAGTLDGEIRHSTEGGPSGWSVIADVGGRVRSLVVSPDFSGDQTLFAGTAGGIVKSIDGGFTWTAPTATSGPAQLAMSPDYGVDQTVFAATKAGLLASTDGGSSWAPVVSGPLTATSRVQAVEVSPDFAGGGVVLASTADVGLLKSVDGGVTFAATGAGLLANNTIISDNDNPTATPIAFSPDFAADRTVFAYGQQDVVKSTDGGATWQALPIPPAADLLGPPEIAGSPADRVTEPGGAGTTVARIPVDLEHPAIFTVTVDWSTIDGVGDPSLASAASGDFVAAAGTLTFLEGDTRKWIEITVKDDSVAELTETLQVQLANPGSGSVPGSGLVTTEILDDDPLPSIRPSGFVANPEGDAGSAFYDLPATLSHPSSTPVTVDYATLAGAPGGPIATPGVDYAGPFSGTLMFLPGDTTATVPVEVYGDTIPEPPLLYGEWGLVLFGSPSPNATLDTSFFGLGLAIIIDDD